MIVGLRRPVRTAQLPAAIIHQGFKLSICTIPLIRLAEAGHLCTDNIMRVMTIVCMKLDNRRVFLNRILPAPARIRVPNTNWTKPIPLALAPWATIHMISKQHIVKSIIMGCSRLCDASLNSWVITHAISLKQLIDPSGCPSTCCRQYFVGVKQVNTPPLNVAVRCAWSAGAIHVKPPSLPHITKTRTWQISVSIRVSCANTSPFGLNLGTPQ